MAPRKKRERLSGRVIEIGRAEKTNSAFPAGESGMVVGQVVQDGKSPVKLFGKE